MQPEIVYKLFQCDTDYASQQYVPKERRLQFLFLSIIHHMHMPSTIRSLTGKCTASCRDPEKILRSSSDALPSELLRQLKRALCHHNPSKFKGHVTADQRKQARAYGNHVSVRKTNKGRENLKQGRAQQMRSRLPMLVRMLLPRPIPDATRPSVQGG